MQVVSVRPFKRWWTDDDVHPTAVAAAALHSSSDDSCFCCQVMSHNKERRSKRDEKLDKKSQAMEELKAEREKKKNKTGWSVFHPSLMAHTEKLTSPVCGEQQNFWPNVSRWKPARFTPTMKRKRRKMTTSPRSKATGVPVRPRLTMTSKFLLLTLLRLHRSPFVCWSSCVCVDPAEKKK